MSMTSQPRPSSSRRSSRSFSPFRRFSSRPSSVIIPNNNDVPDLPHHDFSSASFKDERGRPKSYPAAAALGTDWGSPPEYEKLDGVGSSGRTDSPPPHRLKEESRVTEERGRERLGVLPSPARSAFQSEGAAGVGGGNDIVESVVRHATPALSHTVTAEERTPTQESVNAHAKTAHPGSSSDFDPTANGAVGKGPGNRSSMITPKHAPYEIGGRQRAVSLPRPEYVMPPRYYGAREEPVGLLRPEYVMPPRSGGTEKEPVSPISPLEEGDSSPEDVKPGTGLVAAAQDVSVERVSGDTLSRVSEDSWEKISNADVEGHPTTTGNSVHDVDVAKRSATPSVEVPSAIPSLKGSVQNAAVWFATSSIQGSAHDDLPPSTSATPSFQENTHSLPASTSPTTSLGRGADELLTTSKSANPSPDGSEHNVLATSTCATSSLKGSALNIPISTSETPSMTASSYKGKERAVSPVESEFFPISPSINHSRDHSAVSAILGEAQVVQVPQFQPNATNEIRNAPPPKTQPPQPSTSPPPLPQFGIGTPFEKPVRKIAVSEAQQSDRLAEIALAHKKMREQLDNFTPGSPHDFGATDEAGRKFDEVMERRSMVRGDSRSLRGVAGAPNLAVPTMTSLAPPEKGRARSKSGVSEGNLSVPSFGAEGQGSRFGGGMSNTNASILPPAGPSRQERSGRGPSEQNKPFLLGVSSGNQRAQQNNAAVGGSKAPSPAPVSRAAMEDRPLPRGPISRATPLALDQPSPLGPTMTVTEPEHELPMASQDEVEARGETVGPALSVGGRSIRDEDVTGKDNMNSSLSVGGRSMPSVSSLGRDNDISDTQSPVSQDRSVSPIKGSFENREYHPPNPNGERPMSFVPLPRDPSGLPQQEIISTTKHPIETGSPETPQRSRRNSYTRSSPSPGTPRRRSRQLSLHMDEVRESQDLYDPPSPVTSRHPQSQAPQRELSLNQGSNGGAEYQRESLTAPVPGISPVHEGQQSESEERRPSSIQESPPRAYGQMDIPSSDSPPEQEHEREVPQSHPGQDDAQQPPPHPALAAPASSPVALPGSEPKKAGMLQKIKGFASSNHASESQSGNTARLQQQQQPQKQPPPPPPELRLSSMTSSVGSQNTSMSKDKKKRSSGILSSFKRPASSGAESHLTGASVDAAGMKGQANESPTQRQTPQNVASTIPPMPTEAPQERMASLKVQNAHLPQRATTHTGEQSSMKKRFSALGSLFGRSGTTGHTPKQSKHNKNAPRSTLIHHVPPNPNPTAFTQRQQQHQGGSLNSKQQDMRRAQWLQDPEQSGVHPPLGGYYAPGNSQDNPQFGHGQGTAGFAAIAAQQGRNKSASSATSSNAKDKRSGSNSSVPWPFKRHGSSNSSGHLSPQVSAQSPLDRIRTDSLGPPSISPVSTRRDSSPGQAGYGRAPPPRLPSGRMGSISEQGFPGQHQERPWALTLPGAEEDDRDITRQEIFHAASARWQRGADGLMYALPRDEASPVTPRRQDWDSHTPTAPHPYGQQQQPPHLEPQMPRSPQRFPPGHAQGSPANPVYSYLPTHIHSPPPRPQSSPGHIVNQYQPQDEPHAITTPDAHPVVIPPLPQGNIPLMQPQPRRMSNSPAMGDQLPARASSLQDPRTGPSYRSNGGGAPAPPPKSPMRSGFTVSTTSTSTTTTTTSDQSLNGSFNPSSASTQTQKRPISTSNAYNPTSPQRSTASNAYTATSLQRSAASPPPLPPPKDIPPTPQLPSLIIPRGGPVGGSGITGPVVHSGRNDAMGSSTRSMQNAMSQQQLHARNKSRDSDDEPVMKAVSYPGDEWMPRWDID
ncbi:hypothetical protein EJ08DRAFT_144837 [Tothia fuscella]|uniref:Uncharacterized protein n=1 Tax=Tothia fuscella TaxID=1048955 RepID=A0A9P4P2V0_9PEZI|nr:hypothetical protein EJ08DRAFT_144837 [Tothia fuscella]